MSLVLVGPIDQSGQARCECGGLLRWSPYLLAYASHGCQLPLLRAGWPAACHSCGAPSSSITWEREAGFVCLRCYATDADA